MVRQTQIPTFPVFSNVGESDPAPSLANRSPRLVIFGGSQRKLQIYQNSLKQLKAVCQLLRIKEIIDIGTPTNLTVSQIDEAPIIKMGKLSVSAIREVLLNSTVGFFDYPTDFLAKSTIFAAYCAYGLLPVSANNELKRTEDGIEAGKHYWTLDHRAERWDLKQEGQAIADNAYAWYQTHNLSTHAEVFAKYLVP